MDSKGEPGWVRILDRISEIDGWIRGLAATFTVLGVLAWGIWRGGVGLWAVLVLTCVFGGGVIVLIKPWDDQE